MRAKPMMNLREAADYMGIGVDTLRDYARRSTVPAFKLGAGKNCAWHFSRVALDKWMEDLIERQTSRRKRKAA